MKVFTILALLTVAPAMLSADQAPKAAKGNAGRTVEITGGDDMKFSVTEIPAKRGERIRIVLTNVGKMPKVVMGHNVVVLKLGADPVAFNTAALNARATDFIPPELKDQILAATAQSGPGETVEVSFTVPAKAGRYPYFCSFAGHYGAGMRGEIVVK